MSTDDEQPVSVSFANAKTNALAGFRQTRQGANDNNKKKRKRKRGGVSDILPEKKNHEKKSRIVGGDDDMEVVDNLHVMDTEDAGPLSTHVDDKQSDTDEGYNGSEESFVPLPERTSVRLSDDPCHRLVTDPLRFRDELLHGKRQVRRINMRRFARDRHKSSFKN